MSFYWISKEWIMRIVGIIFWCMMLCTYTNHYRNRKTSWCVNIFGIECIWVGMENALQWLTTFFQIGDQTNDISNCYPRRRKVTIYPLLGTEERKIKLFHTTHKTEGFLQNNIPQVCLTESSLSANLDEARRTLFY